MDGAVDRTSVRNKNFSFLLTFLPMVPVFQLPKISPNLVTDLRAQTNKSLTGHITRYNHLCSKIIAISKLKQGLLQSLLVSHEWVLAFLMVWSLAQRPA